MQVAPFGGHASKLHYILAKLVTSAIGATCWSIFELLVLYSGTTYNWPNSEPMQVAFFLAGELTQVK